MPYYPSGQWYPLLAPYCYLGILFWLVGMAFEAGGDWQLARFKADPANRGKVLDSGLWRYSRHPNYCGRSAGCGRSRFRATSNQEMTMRTLKSLLALPVAFMLVACQTAPNHPITTVERVDLECFMGDWYVIANIPTFIERDAYNAVESYRLTDEGAVATTFTFRRGGFDGERKVYTPTGFVRDRDSNAVWGMQFIWPIKADFRIVYLDEDYTQTIIGRNKRDYVWIMARSPSMPEADYQNLLRLLADEGYDIDQIQRVPQRWPEPHGAGSAPGRHGGARGLS